MRVDRLGWRILRSLAHSFYCVRRYFWHTETYETSWTDPAAPAPAGADKAPATYGPGPAPEPDMAALTGGYDVLSEEGLGEL